MTSVDAITATNKCQPTLKLAIASVLEFVPNVSVHVFMPHKVLSACTALTDVVGNGSDVAAWHDIHPRNPAVRAQYSPNYWYSVFMTDPELWRWISAPYVLVFQADTLVCRPIDLQRLVSSRYDYIGGPTIGYRGSVTRVPWRNMGEPLRVHLNGGIALHRRTWTAACAEKMLHVNLNEDSKWNRCNHTAVSARDAFSFGSDNGITACFTFERVRICPTVVHKPWVRSSGSKLMEMERSCPRLSEMRRSWSH